MLLLRRGILACVLQHRDQGGHEHVRYATAILPSHLPRAERGPSHGPTTALPFQFDAAATLDFFKSWRWFLGGGSELVDGCVGGAG
jgi:hypothetical protein